ncbi:GEVED domain-containing protein [Larkinella sp.]|uniref:GEVED domain-containing protein n=1 Tax=Larkinella sp. TaxID=2034517 RepID=UPI003BAAA674
MESATRRDKGSCASWAVGLLLLLLLPFSQARAQFQDHIWYFGNSTAGISFDNATNQPSALNNQYTPFGAEGCFVATNPTTGQLMFYTSGNEIINRNHQVMQGGNLVFPAPAPVANPAGGWVQSVNGAQSVAVIEKPNGVATGDCGKFLYFINDANEWGGSAKPGSIYIGQIDMNANAGLGAVTQQPTRILTTNAFTESMFVVARPDNQGAWLILNNVLTNRIEVYAVTAAGTVTATPVSTYTIAGVNWSTAWTAAGNPYYWLLGSIAYHQKTGKFALSLGYLGGYNLYVGDFNNTTGAISGVTNAANFYSPPSTFIAYGTEFSPSGKWLYFSIAANGVGALRAYNMQTGVDIGNINGNGNGWPNLPFLGLKTGPDGKLWVNTNGYGGDPYGTNRAVRSTFNIENPVVDGFVSFPLPVNTFSYRFPDFLSLIPPPTALNDQATGITNCSQTSTTIASLTNDVNNATGNLYIDQITQQPLHGTAQIVSNQLVYTLTDLAFVGTDTIKYLVRSDASCYAPGTIASAIIPVSQCPLDFGDAPDTYLTSLATGGASHLITPGLHIGAVAPDIEASGIPATANAAAQSDDNIGSDDEDGVSAFANLCTTSTSYTLTVPVTNTGTVGARLIGWIDFNRNGVFESSEAATVNTPSSGSYQLVWSGLSGLSAGFSYARLRLTSDPAITNSTPAGRASNGEVEDYRLSISTGGGTITPDITSRTVCSGTQIAINYTTNPVGSQVNWTRLPDSLTGVGNVVDVPTATGTTPVSYTYTAWIASAFGCPSNVVTTVVTVNPVPVITPSVCSQTICSGQTGAITFVSSVSATINWLRVEDGATGTGNISQLFNTAGTNTYKIWGVSAAPASCPSSTTITCVIVVNQCTVPCNLTVTAAATNTAVCVGQAINLTSTVTGNVGPVTYAWSGPNGFASTLANPTLPSASSLTAGTYTVTVSDPSSSTGCIRTAAVTVTVGSPTVAVFSNSPLCAGSTLTLFATGGFTTYTWSGPNGFASNQQNPTLPNATTAASGIYTVTASSGGGCTATSSATVTIATQPSLSITTGSGLTICSGQPATLSVTGDGGATVNWTNNLGQSGTGTTINFPGLLNVSGSPQSLTYVVSANAGSCSDSKTVILTINPMPTLKVTPLQSIVCALEQTTVTAVAQSPTAIINWSRSPATPAPATGTGTGSVTVTETLPVGTYTYSFTTTQGGCTSAPVTTQVIVNN